MSAEVTRRAPWRPLAAERSPVNVCCLREDNLRVTEDDEGKRVTRVCRICQRRHIWFRAQPVALNAVFGAPTKSIRTRNGVRHIRMPAVPGQHGA